MKLRRSMTESATSAPARTRKAGSPQSAPIRAAVAPNSSGGAEGQHPARRAAAGPRPTPGTGRPAPGPWRGRRSMATGRSRPTTRPSRAQPATSTASISGIVGTRGVEHDGQWRGFPRPQLEGQGGLVDQHPEAVGARDARGPGPRPGAASRPGGRRCRGRTGPALQHVGVERRTSSPRIPSGRGVDHDVGGADHRRRRASNVDGRRRRAPAGRGRAPRRAGGPPRGPRRPPRRGPGRSPGPRHRRRARRTIAPAGSQSLRRAARARSPRRRSSRRTARPSRSTTVFTDRSAAASGRQLVARARRRRSCAAS